MFWKIKKKKIKIKGHAFEFLAPTLLLIIIIIRIIWIESITLPIAKALFSTLLKEIIPLALLALGSGLVLSTAGVDLSSSGVMTISGVIFALCSQHNYHYGLVFLFSILASALSGFLLGYIVSERVNPLIASWSIGVVLIVCSIFIASSSLVTGGSTQDVRLGTTFLNLDWTLDGKCIFYLISILLAVILFLELSNLPPQAKAVGANMESSVLLGVSVKRVILTTYLSSSLLSGAAGIIYALTNSAATTVDHVGSELKIIAVAVLGGTFMGGGYFNKWSIICASAFWVILNNILKTLDIPWLSQEHQDRGASIIFALIILGSLFVLRRKLALKTQSIIIERVIK